MTERRIKGERVEIDQSAVKRFFDGRGRNFSAERAYNSVLYQDKNPELALARDKEEKRKILPLLQLDEHSRLLDVGCGVGRWADELAGQVEVYLGTDLSEPLIEAARSRHQSSHVCFQVMSAEDIGSEALAVSGPFDRVISAGLLIYLNDDQLIRFLNGLNEVLSPSALIYMREPIGVEARLTLRQIWSDDLEQEYSAIYRTKQELLEAFQATPLAQRFAISEFRPLYDNFDLETYQETRQFYWLLRGAAR